MVCILQYSSLNIKVHVILSNYIVFLAFSNNNDFCHGLDWKLLFKYYLYSDARVDVK